MSDSKSAKKTKLASKDSEQIVQLTLSQRIFSSIFTVFSTIFAFFGGQFGGGLLTVLLLSFVYKPDKIKDVVNDNHFVQMLLILVVEIVTVLFVYMFIKLRGVNVIRALGLEKKPTLHHLGKAFLTFGVYFVCLVITIVLADTLIPTFNTDQQQNVGFDGAGTGSLPFVFLSLVVFVPIAEEILFRGYLFQTLEKYAGLKTSAVITSILFGIAHLELLSSSSNLNWVAGLDTLLFSGFLIWLTKKENSLWPAIMLHIIKNLLAFLTLFVIPVLRG